MLHITHKLRSCDNKLVKSLRIENDYQIKFNEHLSMLCSTKAIHWMLSIDCKGAWVKLKKQKQKRYVK